MFWPARISLRNEENLMYSVKFITGGSTAQQCRIIGRAIQDHSVLTNSAIGDINSNP